MQALAASCEPVFAMTGKEALDYVHTVSFSLGFYIVLRSQGIRKQMHENDTVYT